MSSSNYIEIISAFLKYKSTMRYGFIDKNGGSGVPLEKIQIRGNIKGFTAEVLAIMEYKNNSDSPIEAIYVFPLDEEAAVCGFQATIDGRTIVAEIQEKQKARDTYDDAISSGHSAFLLEESDESSDIFQINVGNLPPKQSATVELTFVTTLSVEKEGRVVFVLPAVLNPRYSPSDSKPSVSTTLPTIASVSTKYSFDFVLEVQCASLIEEITSPCNPLKVDINPEDNRQATVRLGEEFKFDADVQVHVLCSKPFEPHALVENGVTKLKDGIKDEFLSKPVVMLNFFPELDSSASLDRGEFIFVVDRSGSMSGSNIKSARETLLLFLKSLPEGCYFNVIGFGSSFTKLFPKSKSYDDSSLNRACSHGESMEADLGGTEILAPLQDVFSQPLIKGYPRQVFLLTDGDVGNTQQVIELVRTNATSARCFTFGIGAGASTALVKGVARAGKGMAEFVASGDKLRAKVIKVLKNALQPALLDCEVTWDLPEGCSAKSIPDVPPPIFSGNSLIMYGLVSDDSLNAADSNNKRSITLSATLATGAKVEKIQHKLSLESLSSKSGDDSLLLHRLAAKVLIQEKQDNDNNAALNEEIVKISKSANVVSKLTSFVAVDKDSNIPVCAPLAKPSFQDEFEGDDGCLYLSFDGEERLRPSSRASAPRRTSVMKCRSKGISFSNPFSGFLFGSSAKKRQNKEDDDEIKQTFQPSTSSTEIIIWISILKYKSTMRYGFIDKNGGSGVPLEKIQIRGNIKGFTAEVLAIMEYKNNSDSPIEAIYVFPLDEDAAVCGFQATIDGRTIVAEIQEKQEARDTYDDAISSGHSAFLLEESDESSDIFHINVGNVPPKQSATVELTFVTTLSVEKEGRAVFVLPAVLNPRYSPSDSKPSVSSTLPTIASVSTKYSFDFVLEVQCASLIEEITSPCNPLKVDINPEDNRQATVRLGEEFKFDADVQVHVLCSKPFEPHALVENGVTKLKDGIKDEFLSKPVVMLNFFPELDSSASLGRAKVTMIQVSIVLVLLASLCRPADLGGTEILTPLQDVFSQPLIKGYPRQVFLLTDGDVGNTQQVIELVRTNATSARCFTFGIGAGASTALVKGVARAGKGMAEFVASGDKLREKVIKVLKNALQPALLDCEVTWDLPEGCSAKSIPDVPPPIFSGNSLIMYGLVSDDSLNAADSNNKGSITLSATLATGAKVEKIQHKLSLESLSSKSGDDSLLLHRLAAKVLIQEKQDNDNNAALNEEIVNISKSANVVSKLTSFVAVDKDSNIPVCAPLAKPSFQDEWDECEVGACMPDSYLCLSSSDEECLPSSRASAPRPTPVMKCRSKGISFSNPFSGFLFGSSAKKGKTKKMTTKSNRLSNRAPVALKSSFGSASNAYDPTIEDLDESMDQDRCASFSLAQKGRRTEKLPNSCMIEYGAMSTISIPAPTVLECASNYYDPTIEDIIHASMDRDRFDSSSIPQKGCLEIVSLQKASGAWKLTAQLASICGVTLDKLKQTCPSQLTTDNKDSLWATAIALSCLAGMFADQKDEWEMVAAKGTKWLKANLHKDGLSYDGIMEMAGNVLTVLNVFIKLHRDYFSILKYKSTMRYGFIDKNGGSGVPLEKIQIRGNIKGFTAEVLAIMEYKNNSDSPIEAIYVFPLDEEAAVCGFQATIDGRTIVAEIQEKQKARDTYDDAISSGHSAFLLEESDERAQTSFKSMLETYHQNILNPRYSPSDSKPSVSTTLPTIASVSTKYSFDFVLEVQCASLIEEITSPCNPLKVDINPEDNRQATVRLGEEFKFDADVQVHVLCSKPFEPHALVENGVTKLKDGIKDEFLSKPVVMFNFFPELDSSASLDRGEFIFVVDRSGSMSGSNIKSARETLLLFLKSLPEGCYFNVIGFGSSFTKLFPKSKSYDDSSLNRACSHGESMEADLGGTEILAPLQDVFSQPLIKGYPRQVFLLTDGDVGNTQQVIELVRTNATSARCFTFGIGAGASTALVKGVARAGKGMAEFVASGDKLRAKVIKVLKNALQPALLDCEVTWDLPEGCSAKSIPDVPPPIFSGNSLIMYGLVSDDSLNAADSNNKGSITLSATLATGAKVEKIQHKLSLESLSSKSGDDSLLLHRLAAKVLIQEKQDNDNNAALNEEIVKISKSANVVSKLTSFVAVDKDSNIPVCAPLAKPSFQDEFEGDDGCLYLSFDGEERLRPSSRASAPRRTSVMKCRSKGISFSNPFSGFLFGSSAKKGKTKKMTTKSNRLSNRAPVALKSSFGSGSNAYDPTIEDLDESMDQDRCASSSLAQKGRRTEKLPNSCMIEY
ncbi:hypothetical protein QZH41_019194, partial [Actinostola sp. cb2023]